MLVRSSIKVSLWGTTSSLTSGHVMPKKVICRKSTRGWRQGLSLGEAPWGLHALDISSCIQGHLASKDQGRCSCARSLSIQGPRPLFLRKVTWHPRTEAVILAQGHLASKDRGRIQFLPLQRSQCEITPVLVQQDHWYGQKEAEEREGHCAGARTTRVWNRTNIFLIQYR